ncbi:MAG: lipopolysaccharide biosynthesis protein [Abditibacteriota bacterium]|nr:lipopolysaccharide biosynthesis protein [Abditibacteriota bacterium]
MKDIKGKAKSGFIYKFAERAGAQGMSFVISMILARLLLPREYGVVAMVLVFISICDVFVMSGFGKSLIAKKNADNLDFSTCLWFSLGISAVIYAAVFFAAPLIAAFYDEEMLVPVVRVMALKLPVTALSCVQESYTSKNMLFRKFFYSTLTGTLSSGVISITMAYMGFGVWALVCQNISRAVINAVVLWFIVGWRPRPVFSFERLKGIYDYGWKILVIGLIDTVHSQLRNLIIGKRYTAQDLAFYSKGHQFPHTGMMLIEATINGVLFPALSHVQDDRKQMREITRRIIRVSGYVAFPVMIGLGVMAKPLVLLILTEKWLECAVYLQITCLALLFRPLQFINNSVILASGNSALLLKLDLLKKAVSILFLAVSMFFGVIWVAWSLVAANFFAVVVNIAPNRKILDYGYIRQIKDVGMSLVMSVIMGGCMYVPLLFGLNCGVTILLQTAVGAGVYLLLTKLTKDDSLEYIIKNVHLLARGRRKEKQQGS